MADNGAPNGTGFQIARIYPYVRTQPSSSLGAAGIVRHHMVSIYQEQNNAPYINFQTYWAAGIVRKPQGY